MAICASCLIWLSSRSRAAESRFLVIDIASPTTTACIGAFNTSSTHRHEIMGDNAPANVSFKSNLPFIKGSLHAEAVFERAQARLNACSPALATPEPALFLSCRSAGAQAAAGPPAGQRPPHRARCRGTFGGSPVQLELGIFQGIVGIKSRTRSDH